MQTEYLGTRDWRYFGVFQFESSPSFFFISHEQFSMPILLLGNNRNSESGLHPIHAYSGEYYKLKTSGNTKPNAFLRITGYGENEGNQNKSPFSSQRET